MPSKLGSFVLMLAPLWLGSAAFAADSSSDVNPRVLLETSMGDIVLELYPDKAPVTVSNFLSYVDADFYDGLIFHRVAAGFVIQGGGYDADMVLREPKPDIPNESYNGLANARGTVAMARLSDPDTANSQFFINMADNTHLDAGPGQPGYTVFGRLVEGMEVAEDIELVETGIRKGQAAVPVEPVVIEGARRLE